MNKRFELKHFVWVCILRQGEAVAWLLKRQYDGVIVTRVTATAGEPEVWDWGGTQFHGFENALGAVERKYVEADDELKRFYEKQAKT